MPKNSRTLSRTSSTHTAARAVCDEQNQLEQLGSAANVESVGGKITFLKECTAAESEN